MSVYENCKSYNGEIIFLKRTQMSDTDDLFECYSDKKSVPFFNSDNCNGDTFFYDTKEKMENALKFWQTAYQNKWFVRWTIFMENKAIGTIEICNRKSDDIFNGCIILRVDVRSDCERYEIISDILKTVEKFIYEEFSGDTVITKGFEKNSVRAETLRQCGYIQSNNALIGHDGTKYYNYYTKSK